MTRRPTLTWHAMPGSNAAYTAVRGETRYDIDAIGDRFNPSRWTLTIWSLRPGTPRRGGTYESVRSAKAAARRHANKT